MQNKICLQCGAPLLLCSKPLFPGSAGSPEHAVCSVCGSATFNTPDNRIQLLTAQRDELLAALTHAATDYIDQNGMVPSWWTDKIRQMVKDMPHA